MVVTGRQRLIEGFGSNVCMLKLLYSSRFKHSQVPAASPSFQNLDSFSSPEGGGRGGGLCKFYSFKASGESHSVGALSALRCNILLSAKLFPFCCRNCNFNICKTQPQKHFPIQPKIVSCLPHGSSVDRYSMSSWQK